MRKIADGEDYRMPATIDDPAVLGEIARAWKRPVMAPWLQPGIGELHPSIASAGRWRAAHIASGKRTINPSRFGIRTLGSVWAFIVSFSPISLFSAKM